MPKLLLTLIALVVLASSSRAQPPDPSTLPRLQLADLEHLGGFLAPQTSSNGENFGYGGMVLAHSPATNTLYLGGHTNTMRVAEITIPAFTKTADPTKMLAATFVQAFHDPTEGQRAQLDANMLGSLIAVGDKLCGTVYRYYDAEPKQAMRVSHYCRSRDLSTASFSGWSTVSHPLGTGFVSGQMTPVPPEWQPRLGGPMLTQQCCIPIVSRTSWGMSATAFDAALIGQPTIPGTPLLYYDEDHRTLGRWSGSSPTYGGTTEMGGWIIIPGTRTALYIGSNGLGPYCYGAEECKDPTSPYAGVHAPPYRSQMWAYDLNDFAAVRAGTKQPWEPVPYAVWPLEFLTKTPQNKIGGVSYDALRKILYVAQLKADQPGSYNAPIIQGIRMNIGATVPPIDPPIDPPPSVDVCTAFPLVVTVSTWPSSMEGARQLRYAATVGGAVVTMAELRHVWTAPQRLQVTDARGCAATVQK